jgi:hypothetical protein
MLADPAVFGPHSATVTRRAPLHLRGKIKKSIGDFNGWKCSRASSRMMFVAISFNRATSCSCLHRRLEVRPHQGVGGGFEHGEGGSIIGEVRGRP